MEHTPQILDEAYWSQRYAHDDTPWDIGNISPPLKAIIDGLSDKGMRILIPGAGKGYEAIYLHRKGFSEVYVCDWVAAAFDTLQEQAPDFPAEHMLIADFFELDLPGFDLILEQTFFCALLPSQRPAYVRKMYELLKPGGRLMGVLFAHEFPFEGPPFGGNEATYRQLFSPLFEIERMELSRLSIGPRAGNELEFSLRKPFK